MTFRGFIAVEVPATEALDRFAAALRGTEGQLRVVDTSQVHATLRFLGETEEGLVEAIVDAIRRSARDIPPFRLRLGGTGCFPSRSRIRVVWIRLQDAGPLPEIAARLDAELQALGFPRQTRGFSPHVTVGRVKGRRNLERIWAAMDAFSEESFGEPEVRTIHLKRSVLSPSGPAYSTVGRVDLSPVA